LLVEADLPWLHYLFAKRYGERYDADTTARWFKLVVIPEALNFYAARTEDAFIGALTTVLPWLPGEPEVNVIAICADDDAGWQVITLLRASIAWARKRNAARWRICSDTEYDLRPLALRVGAREITSRFEIDLRRC
jgi:hypothetical protein